jgi:endonuclease III
MNEEAIKKVLQFGERFRNEYLPRTWKTRVENDWYGGISLLISRAFYQGRRDEVSEMVEKAAAPVLDRYFDGKDISILKGFDFDALKSALMAVIGKGKVGKERDADMVVDIFRFVSRLPEENLARYSVAAIELGDIKKLYKDLMDITSIGPKIASLYLRDLVDVYDLESKIAPGDLVLLQPVDVWVRKVARKTGIINDGVSDEEIKKSILRVCQEAGVSALRFNQGVWYLGKNAFDIVIENLDNIQF